MTGFVPTHPRLHQKPATRRAEYSRASASIGIRDRLSMVSVETIRRSAPSTLQDAVGARLALAATSIGRAYVAGLPEFERNFN